MPTPPATFETVRAILVEQLGVDPAQVTPAARLKEDLGADSLEHVEIIMAFEEEFGCDISDDEAQQVLTVQQALDCVNAQ